MFGIAAALALFGAMMVYSASAMFALQETESGSQYTYFYKQIGFTLGGLALMLIVSQIDYHRFQKPWVVYGLLAITVFGLIAVFAFPRDQWRAAMDTIRSFSFQPSELAKIALPIFLAYFLTKKEERGRRSSATVVAVSRGLGLLWRLWSFWKRTSERRSFLCDHFRRSILQRERSCVHIAAVGGGNDRDWRSRSGLSHRGVCNG